MVHVRRFACPQFGKPASTCGEAEAFHKQRSLFQINVFSSFMVSFVCLISYPAFVLDAPF
jgi:hypothetical protein